MHSLRTSSKYTLPCCATLLFSCGSSSQDQPLQPSPTTTQTPIVSPPRTPTPAAEPDTFPLGLLLSYSQFALENGHATGRPGAARVEFLIKRNGLWEMSALEDSSSNVFHKAFFYAPPADVGEPGIVTLGGMNAAVKLWRNDRVASQAHPRGNWTSETLWEDSFGGRFNRMRDAEAANLFGGGASLAVATHDQGVVATIRQTVGGTLVQRWDRRANTFVHEVEIGDLDGDRIPEVYTTPSDPNNLDGGEQRGQVMRYIPGLERSVPTLVADLGNRHAKEIYVGDVDGDGRDELYVAVEARTELRGDLLTVVEGVEIRRFDHDTLPTARVVVARFQDRLTRFLTVGDVDGDHHKEMVASTFSSGVWLLRPGRDAHGEWSQTNIDRNSGGFEHAALFADLDRNGRDELYVASDNDGELRRYIWVDGRARREVIHRRAIANSMLTWNIMPFPVDILASPVPAPR